MPLLFPLGQHSAFGRSASPVGRWGSSVGFPRRHDAGTGWRSFMHCLKVLSGPTPGYGYNCGTESVRTLADGSHYSEQLWQRTRRASCGGVQRNCPHINGASRSLGLRLVTPILSKPIWTSQRPSTRSCWTGFLMLKTPRLLGCCRSIVRQQGPITLLGWSPHWPLNSFATHMTWCCGGVCVQSSRFLWNRRPTSEELHPCRWSWEEQV